MTVVLTDEVVYRGLEALDESEDCREISYLIECQFWYTPEEGDGWNSPFREATLELEQWLIVEITRHNSDLTSITYRPGFIGPAEPGIVWFGDVLGLTEEECENIVNNTLNEDADD